jgi:hypothetical protein
MFVNLGQAMRRRRSNSSTGKEDKEQFDKGQWSVTDPLTYRLQHLRNIEIEGCCSNSDGDDVDPFDVGGYCSSLEDHSVNEVVKMGAVDDVGWSRPNNHLSVDDNDYSYHEGGDQLLVDFGRRRSDEVLVRQRQKEILSTPRFGSDGSSQSRCDSIEPSRQSLSTISCTKNNDAKDGTDSADIASEDIFSTKSLMEISKEICPLERSTPVTYPQPPNQSFLKQQLATISYRPMSKTSSSSIALSEAVNSNSLKLSSSTCSLTHEVTHQTLSTTQAGKIQAEEEQCPRLEQLQQMSLEELQNELMKVQAHSRANMQTSWKTAESMRVQNSALDVKVTELWMKMNAAFSAGPPKSMQHSIPAKYGDYDVRTPDQTQNSTNRGDNLGRAKSSGDLASLFTLGRRLSPAMEGGAGLGLKSSRSMANLRHEELSEERGNAAWNDDISGDAKAAFALNIELPAVAPYQQSMGGNLKREVKSSGDLASLFSLGRRLSPAMEGGAGLGLKSSRSMANLRHEELSEERGNAAWNDDISGDAKAAFAESIAAVPFQQSNFLHNTQSSNGSVGSGDSSDFGLKFDMDSETEENFPFQLGANHQVVSDQSDNSSVFFAPKFVDTHIIEIVKTGSVGGDASPKPDQNEGSFVSNKDAERSRGLQRSPSLVRRPSFLSLFGLNDTSKTGGECDDASFSCMGSSNCSTNSDPIEKNTGDIFRVEARAVMIDELEKYLNEKDRDVDVLIQEIEEQKEEIESCEVEISRLQAKFDNECKDLACNQSRLQQLVKELLLWDSAIESILDHTEGCIHRIKQKERDLKCTLAKEFNGADCKIYLEQLRSCKEEYITIKEKSRSSLSKVIDNLTAMNILRFRDDDVEQRTKKLFDNLDTQTDILHNLLGDPDRRALFVTLKRHIEDQRERIIKAYFHFFAVETDLRGFLIRARLESIDEWTHTTDRSIATERRLLERSFVESVLPHFVEAREEFATFQFATLTKCDEFLSYWDPSLVEDSLVEVEDCVEFVDADNISSTVRRIIGVVTENLASIEAKIDEKHNSLRAGILGQQRSVEKFSIIKQNDAESSDCRAELDHVNAQISTLEASLSERQTLQNEYEANLEKLHRQDEVDSKSNLELLDNIQAQVKILAEKLTLDDNQIASLRQSLKEKKEQVSDLEYGKRGRNFMNT